MNLPRLYALTDEDLVPNHRLLDKVEVVLEAGVRLLQVRFKNTPHEEQNRLGKELRELTSAYGALFILNDFPEVARSVAADGVHLGAQDPRVDFTRKLLGPKAIIGVSCYDQIERITQWGSGDISYLGIASPYPSPTKAKVSPGLDTFRNLIVEARVPVYAIGGITPSRVGEMIKAGCHGVAVISAIFGVDDPAKAIKEFLSELAGYPNE
ncbi:thiamine phosphate synthase [candidate division WOR-3 bacterium]|nr:thiamine phosphate synthase [candidate division WOR-3 bacterium]